MPCSSAICYDETQPLLQQNEENSPPSPASQPPGLRLSQLAVLCFLRILDPLNFTQIFPYINEFVLGLHLTEDSSQVGFYSGMIESVFALAQLIAIYPWSSLSDTVGRRKVIIFGVFGLSISTILFGVSQTFWTAMISRGIAGLFSGNVPVVPTVLCEITSPENESFVFPFFGIFWPIGMVLGPLIGGSLSNIALKYPTLFHRSVFAAYPYLLPCLVVAAFNLIGMVSAHILLNETRKTDMPTLDLADTKPLSTQELFADPMMKCLCSSASFLSFVTTAFDVVFVLFCYTTIEKGGLGLENNQIGYALAISGMVSGCFQLFLMPKLLRAVDHAKCYHLCVAVWPAVFLMLPVLNVFARYAIDVESGSLGPRARVKLWTGIAVVLFIAKVGFLPYTINTLLVKRYNPSPSSLGASNGLLQFFICLSRSFSPFVSSVIFTISAETNLFMGYGWALLLSAASFWGTYFSGRVVNESKRRRELS
ncbi:hypothetical protein GYMLUDRAFT_444784 [Collybiopsis luxurians FD-317 M1]|uniref:Major facilitator superfamily (MFS) profile domain-containing protein n=1 Tax=Collybiopsis luxurians FD-317 M1 TaxID=944289 RepID=A0A0D0CVD0_9AGAR|nr:hypothetical protein GYMLUDRAFT_444784 [Collybiopsis luxurians FD-317 M1]